MSCYFYSTDRGAPGDGVNYIRGSRLDDTCLVLVYSAPFPAENVACCISRPRVAKMAELLRFICENSDHSQILVVLKRSVERKDLAVDTNFLESLKLVLSELEKSKNLTEDLASKVLKEICWPIVYGSSLDKDRQLPGNNRKKLHLCYDIVAFCCSLFPTTLLSEICEKSLQVLRRYVVETSATEENAHDASVTLDLIGNLVRSDSLNSSHNSNVICGETGDKLFLELLNILPHSTESLCGKVTGLVLPKFLEYKRTERCEVSYNRHGLSGNEGNSVDFKVWSRDGLQSLRSIVALFQPLRSTKWSLHSKGKLSY